MQKQPHVNWVGFQKGWIMGKLICKQVENDQHELKEVVMDLNIKIGETASTLPTTSKNSWSVFWRKQWVKRLLMHAKSLCPL